MNLDPPSIGFFRKPCEKMAKPAVEQRHKISFRRAVRIELKKQVAANGRGKIEPLTYPARVLADRSRRFLLSQAAA